MVWETQDERASEMSALILTDKHFIIYVFNGLNELKIHSVFD